MLLQRGFCTVASVFRIGQARQTWQQLHRSVANKTAIIRLAKGTTGYNFLRFHWDEQRLDSWFARNIGARRCDIEERSQTRDTKGAANVGQYVRNN